MGSTKTDTNNVFGITIRQLHYMLIVALVTTTFQGNCQEYKPVWQSNHDIEFADFLSGVKYAYIAFQDKDAALFSDESSNAIPLLGIIDYLEKIGLSDVTWGTFSQIPPSQGSICDLTIVTVAWGYENDTFTKIRISFSSCNRDNFIFETENEIKATKYTDVRKSFYNRCLSMCGYRKEYSISNRLKLHSEMTKWDENLLKNHLLESGADAIEGIYESFAGSQLDARYKVGVIKDGAGYTVFYINGAYNKEDWNEGEIKATLIETATPNLYKSNWYMANKSINDEGYIGFEDGLMNIIWSNQDKVVYIKLYPTHSDGVKISKNTKSSGTGFALSSIGHIVTNHHVIEDAQSIKVYGLNGNFVNGFNAELIIEDIKNDLAIIKINDPSFNSLGIIPYMIDEKVSDVGINVYALGYPLRASMGDEVKLTTGIISSKTGFQGDVTTYQVSVPVQPGNSGGPLFNSSGNIIGIISSKHLQAENASYGIKSNYLLNLIQSMNDSPSLPQDNIITNKALSVQIKYIKKFVYIIEIN